MAHIGPVNLQVNPGEIVCVSGKSGIGKSLLLRAIADIIDHTGQVSLGQQVASAMPAPQWRRQVSLLPAENQWWLDNVYEHFASKDNVLLEQLGFDNSAWQWQLANCSTGEKQRLALLRLLVNKPQCLLLDEPTASLDPENIERVEAVLRQYAETHKAPVLWVSHSREQIERVAARHFIMCDGRLVAT